MGGEWASEKQKGRSRRSALTWEVVSSQNKRDLPQTLYGTRLEPAGSLVASRYEVMNEACLVSSHSFSPSATPGTNLFDRGKI